MRALTAVVGLAGAVAAASCGGGESGPEVADLAGRTFVAERSGGQVIVVDFLDAELVHVDLGCNHLHDVPWDVVDGRLELPEPFLTDEACSEGDSLRDQGVLTILASLPELDLDDATLTATDDTGTDLVLTETDSPPPAD